MLVDRLAASELMLRIRPPQGEARRDRERCFEVRKGPSCMSEAEKWETKVGLYYGIDTEVLDEIVGRESLE